MTYGDKMKLTLKRFTAGIAMLAVIIFSLSYIAFASYDIKILINGKALDYEESPEIIDGEVFLPMREVFEKLGATVIWNEEERSAESFYKGNKLKIYPDSGRSLRNGKTLKYSVSTQIKKGRIMIPLPLIAEGLGCNAIWNGENYTVSIAERQMMKIYFLDCGQADSTFIELPDGKCMLIDSAESSFGESLEAFIKEKGYFHIDYVFATHPHSDHIGGMEHILNSFTVGTFFMPEVYHTTRTYEKMIYALEKNGCKCVYPKKGETISDILYSIEVLSPQNHSYNRMNDSSVVIKLSYDNVSLVLSADAEVEAEAEMLAGGVNLKADILKVGHHGSESSTSEEYLDAVSPREAVIFAGSGNPYGFPDSIITERLMKRNINIYRTDVNGNISVNTDGYIYLINADKE